MRPSRSNRASGAGETPEDSSLLDAAAGQPDESGVKFVDRRPWASRATEGGSVEGDGPDEGAPGEAGPRYPSFVEELKARAEAAERTTAEIQERYRQAESRMDETRRKLSQDVSRRVEVELARLGRDLISGMLPVLDDLERALRTARGGAADAAFVSGVELVRKNFVAALAAQGVERIETAGLPYDPEVAEAVQAVPVAEPAQDGIVLEELDPAWRFRGQMLRPARVRVGRFRAES